MFGARHRLPGCRARDAHGMSNNTSQPPRLRLGLPKGSLQDATLEKFSKAGWNITVSSRSYEPYVDDAELSVRLIRAQEIGRYVALGYLDAGLTGHDWIVENGVAGKVHEVGEFVFSKATRQPTRWVLAVPEESPIRTVRDLEGKRIATELTYLIKTRTHRYRVTPLSENDLPAVTVLIVRFDEPSVGPG